MIDAKKNIYEPHILKPTFFNRPDTLVQGDPSPLSPLFDDFFFWNVPQTQNVPTISVNRTAFPLAPSLAVCRRHSMNPKIGGIYYLLLNCHAISMYHKLLIFIYVFSINIVFKIQIPVVWTFFRHSLGRGTAATTGWPTSSTNLRIKSMTHLMLIGGWRLALCAIKFDAILPASLHADKSDRLLHPTYEHFFI